MKFSVLRRLLVSIAVITSCFFVVDRVAGYVLNGVVKQSGFRFSEVYAGENDAEVIILGNSRAVNAFYAPEMEQELGRSVFNLGYNGMSMELCEVVFLDYLEHNERPSIVILEVTNLNVSNGLLKDFKLFAGMSARISELLRRDESVLYRASQLTHLYRFNSELFLRTLVYLKGDDQAWINTGSISKEFAENFEAQASDKGVKNIYPISGRNWESLLRIIETCQSHDIEVRLVASPYLPAYRRGLVDYESWQAGLNRSLPDSCQVYDFSTSLNDFSSFADPLHINRKGSLLLLNEMIEAGIFNLGGGR